jgi:DNA-binding NtrC family response regulator
MCEEGLFRNDLYYRLNIFPIEIPSLKKRGEDISLLAEVFLKRLNNLYQKDIHGIHLNVLNAFKKYSWPGNIREMEHLIERAYVVEKGHVLMPESFPIELLTLESSLTPIALNTSLSLSEVRRKALGDIEREYITDVLVKNKGKIYNAAQAAGITTRHLHNLMKKYGIDKKKFK